MAACQVCEIHAESVFKIEGMDCHEEVAILERSLKRLSGLEALDADVMGQRLRVSYDAAKLTTTVISEAVARTGMRAWLEHEEPQPAATGAATRLRLTQLSAVLLGLGFLQQLTAVRLTPSWLPFVLSIALGVGPIAQRAATSLRAAALDINVLMLVAVAGAAILGEWGEAASVVFLFALAQRSGRRLAAGSAMPAKAPSFSIFTK